MRTLKICALVVAVLVVVGFTLSSGQRTKQTHEDKDRTRLVEIRQETGTITAATIKADHWDEASIARYSALVAEAHEILNRHPDWHYERETSITK